MGVVASLTAKFERGLMPQIRKIMEEEAKAVYKILSSKSNPDGSGGFWAYDYSNTSKPEDEHSYANWEYDLVRVGKSLKVVIWNTTRPNKYYNYVAKIAHEDLSTQTSSAEYETLIREYKERVKARIRQLKGVR